MSETKADRKEKNVSSRQSETHLLQYQSGIFIEYKISFVYFLSLCCGSQFYWHGILLRVGKWPLNGHFP